jgi:hypothetical protein
MAPSRSDWPAAYHPEFGMICPSVRRRRALRLVTAMAATLAIGTTIGLAGVHRPDRDAVAAAAIATDEPNFAKASTPAGDFAPAAQSGQDFCRSVAARDPVASFLNPGCSAPKPRHGKRGAGRSATFVLSRTDVPR